MSTTPQIQLTATLQDTSGNAINRAKLIITLCNFGATIPTVVGTSLLAKIGPIEYTLQNGTTPSGGIPLWGNDVITPVNATFYCITIEDDKHNIVQSGNYIFTGTGLIDLSNAQQIDSNMGMPPMQFTTGDLFVILANTQGQQLRADINDIIAALTAQGYPPKARPKPMPAAMPTGSRSLRAAPGNTFVITRSAYNGQLMGLFYNGNMLINPLHYTFSGRTITLTFNAGLGDNLYAQYVAISMN